MRIVIDTNALVSILPKISPYRLVIEKLLKAEIELIVSTSILLEYDEIISLKTNQVVAFNFLEFLIQIPNVIKLEPLYKWRLIEIDADDNKFVDSAIAGNADYIVTNDSHFNILKTIPFPKVQIIKLDDFIKLLNNETPTQVGNPKNH